MTHTEHMLDFKTSYFITETKKLRYKFFRQAVSFVTKTFLANPLISKIYDTLAAFGAQLWAAL